MFMPNRENSLKSRLWAAVRRQLLGRQRQLPATVSPEVDSRAISVTRLIARSGRTRMASRERFLALHLQLLPTPGNRSGGRRFSSAVRQCLTHETNTRNQH